MNVCHMPFSLGWTAVVEIGQDYEMAWENIEHITNISYDAGFYDMVSTDSTLANSPIL